MQTKQNIPTYLSWSVNLPAHWQTIKLKYLATIKTGRTPKIENSMTDYFQDGTIDWFTPSDFKNSIEVSNSTRKVTQDAYNNKQIDLYPARSIYLIGIGATLGKIAYCQTAASANQQVNILIPNARLNSLFLVYFLQATKHQILALADFTTLPILNQSKTKEIIIALPPLTEQTAIVTYLNRKLTDIDIFIAKKQRLITLLQEQKAAMINKAVTKGLNENETRPSGIAWLGDIPTHWEVKKLRYVANCYPSNVDKHSKENEKQVRLCNYTDVYKNDFITNDMDLMLATATDEQIEKFTLRKNDVIITKDSETADDIAVPALVKEDLENVICGYHLSILRPYETLLGLYLMRALQCKVLNIQFEVCAHGVTRVGLGVYDIRSAKIPVPPLAEQIAIVSHIEAESARIDKAIQLIERELTLVQEYRTALIAEAVTGKIDCTP